MLASIFLSLALLPANNATAVNADVQLKLTFSSAPRVGASGKIRIYDESNGRVVDTLDMSIPSGPTKPVDPAVRAKDYLAFPYPYARTSRPTNRDTKPGTPSAEADRGGHVHFWEYDSRNADASPVDMSRRGPWSRKLDSTKDAKLIEDYSRPEFVLAGWKPQLN
jgi:hypothetical protein